MRVSLFPRLVRPLAAFSGIASLLLSSVHSSAYAQLAPPPQAPVVGARMPALSPDGKKLAFVWRGDIWVSAADGGRAYRVTDHVDLDAYPVFSPDGNWIAFSSTRTGNWDIFVVPATGGEARQITFSSDAEQVSDWSPDGKNLLFTAGRDLRGTGIFAADVQSGRTTLITEDYEPLRSPAYSPDGKRVAYGRGGAGFPWTRPRYHGSGAAQLWEAGGAAPVALRDDERQHLWPHYLPGGGIVCVTVGNETPNSPKLNQPLPPLADSDARTPNLWVFPSGVEGGKGRQLTHFVGGAGVRCPSVARQTGDLAFEDGADLYRLPAGAKEPRKITLFCGAEFKQNIEARQVFTNSDVEEAEVSPDGKTWAFAVKGDIWTIPVEKGKGRNADEATRLTTYPGNDHDFVWGRDNKTLFFVSDRDGNERVYALDVATKALRPVWTGVDDAGGVQISPDGTLVSFWVTGGDDVLSKTGGLYVAPVAGGTPRRLVTAPGELQGEYSWSPDGRWVAYTRRGVESRSLNVYIAPTTGNGQPVNVTRLNAGNRLPRWSPDGKYLFFASDRDGDGLYVLPLKPEDARADELEIKYEKPVLPVSVAIDWEDTAPRIRRLPTDPVPGGDLTFSGDGQIFFVARGDAWSCGYDGKDAKRLTTTGNVSGLRLSPDGKTIYWHAPTGLYSQKLAPGAGPVQSPFAAAWVRNLRAERAAAFRQFWRTYRTRFYDGGFHGRNWDEIRTRYEPLLSAVDTREEFATLLNMMIGEVEASHSEAGPAPGGTSGPTTPQLGVFFDYSYGGPGIRVKDVPRRAPGSYSKTGIKPGEYIVAVDGQDVTLSEGLYKLLNDKPASRDFVLTVNDKPGRVGARTVTYRALSTGEWHDIEYRNRVERLRKLVDEKSHGTLAYVHIAGMGGGNVTTFDRELYEYAEGKKGVIIDVRFNGGGNTSDKIINWLGMRSYGVWLPRNGYPIPAPGGYAYDGTARSWDKPVVALTNQRSLSNAEMFAYSVKAAGVGKTVGVATPGYCIWTYGWTLVDGTSVRMPYTGAYRRDGTTMENDGERPDFLVPLSNADYQANRDPQLEKAIELLMK